MTRRILLISMLGIGVGCSALVGQSDEGQCQRLDDCSLEATGLAGLTCSAGLCVMRENQNDFVSCAEDPAPDTSFTWDAVVISATTRAPLAGATIEACNLLDIACEAPVAETVVGEDGGYRLELSPAFRGFIRHELEGYAPLVTFTNNWARLAATQDVERSRTQEMIRPEDFELLAMLVGVDVDLSKGHAFFAVHDCSLDTVPGVRASLAPSSDAWVGYLRAGFPSRTATETDDSGNGVVLNMPPGLLDLVLTETGVATEVGRVSFRSTAGELAIVNFMP